MKIGVCTSLDHAPVLAHAGFDYLEENVQTFLLPEEPEAAFQIKLEQARQAALPIRAANCFLPSALKCLGPEVDEERLLQYAETAFRRAQQVGIDLIVFGSGGARQVPQGFDFAKAQDQFISFLRKIAPLAERYDATLVLEPLNKKETNFMNSLVEGAAVVEAVSHPRIRLLADFYHMRMDEEPPDEILRHGRWIEHVHLAERVGRQAPGTQGEDFGPYLQALQKIAYRHAISLECNWRDLPAQAAGSLRELNLQLNRAG